MTEFWTLIEFRGGLPEVDFTYSGRIVRAYSTEHEAKKQRRQILKRTYRVNGGIEILHTTIHEDGEESDGVIRTRTSNEWVEDL